ADPRLHWTLAQYQQKHDFVVSVLSMYGAVNLALDDVDSTLTRLNAKIADMTKAGAPASQIAAVQSVVNAGQALRGRMSAGYKNDEDSINQPGQLREKIQGLLFANFGSLGPPISTHYALEAVVRASYEQTMSDYKAWSASARRM
ncbi:MAG: hypothetical protein JO194_06840, partial [Candidatus Eremiobacteraeota bacterium]|nr:hypothetical protein [Candidatus Eremiobacteraeota bacterium]